MNNKSLFSPDHVLSLVVLVLALFLIFSAAFLNFIQNNISYAGAMIGSITSRNVEQIRAVNQTDEESEDDVSESSTEIEE